MDSQMHWEKIYQTKGRDEVSWYREHLDTSLRLITNTGVVKDAAIIDVGGGDSTLVDDLLVEGYVDVTVLDISGTALLKSMRRLEANAKLVNWIESDITTVELALNRYDVWHDRAVFHFLTDEEDRRKYVERVMRSLKPGGHIIVASFGLEGPTKCSGLDIVQYSPETMHHEFGHSFELVESVGEEHQTPFGTTQDFVYCYCRKV